MTETDDDRSASAAATRAVVIAGHQGDLETIDRHLTHPEPTVRAAALGAAARAGAITAATLVDALTDPSAVVRRRALEVTALGLVPAEQVDVLPLLDDPDDRVVETAAWALGELAPPDPRSVEPLCALVSSHADSLVREAAVAALGAIGDSRGLDTILGATTDIATVRRRAIIALAPFDGPEVDAALERARSDRDWQVRQAAEDLLAPPPPD